MICGQGLLRRPAGLEDEKDDNQLRVEEANNNNLNV